MYRIALDKKGVDSILAPERGSVVIEPESPKWFSDNIALASLKSEPTAQDGVLS